MESAKPNKKRAREKKKEDKLPRNVQTLLNVYEFRVKQLEDDLASAKNSARHYEEQYICARSDRDIWELMCETMMRTTDMSAEKRVKAMTKMKIKVGALKRQRERCIENLGRRERREPLLSEALSDVEEEEAKIDASVFVFQLHDDADSNEM